MLGDVGEDRQNPTQASGSAPDASARAFVVTAPISLDDLPGLVERARAFLDDCDTDVVVCDVGDLSDPDAVALDALARLQLLARRHGRQVRLRHAPADLQALLDLAGLCEIVPTD